jgi:hypothetical protein
MSPPIDGGGEVDNPAVASLDSISAAEDSAWREILQYFSAATQIGLTATPNWTACTTAGAARGFVVVVIAGSISCIIAAASLPAGTVTAWLISVSQKRRRSLDENPDALGCGIQLRRLEECAGRPTGGGVRLSAGGRRFRLRQPYNYACECQAETPRLHQRTKCSSISATPAATLIPVCC